MRLALLQPASFDVPPRASLTRPPRMRSLRPCLESFVMGGTRSGHAPFGTDAADGEVTACFVTSGGLQSDAPAVCVEIHVPGSLPGARMLGSLGSGSTAGQIQLGMQSCFIVTPQTSGERPQASPLSRPEIGPALMHAPISSLAVPTSAGTLDIRDSVTVGDGSNALSTCA